MKQKFWHCVRNVQVARKPREFHLDRRERRDKLTAFLERKRQVWANSSGGEHLPYKQGVGGSKPPSPTRYLLENTNSRG